ncbi:hypothetical protein [Mesorhizobium sp.]|uniref:hypothetical protein n=1 Tax=Mesorhizobium sp. TaxID=1871066 RepID=UPI001211A5C5|nr:hypothetical protein [Mesorhizobium sp.]TIN08875.1 MAG: hypothetical protein E5Y14_17995 [Mesorhizobium sp.]
MDLLMKLRGSIGRGKEAWHNAAKAVRRCSTPGSKEAAKQLLNLDLDGQLQFYRDTPTDSRISKMPS